MNNRKKNGNGKLFVLLLLLLVIGVSVGYAALSKTLNINGTSNIANNARWDVHLENVVVTGGSANATTPAKLSGTDTITFAVDLNTPGDFYEFTFDVVNDGTIDAKLNTKPSIPSIPENLKSYVTYTVTYSDGGTALNANDTLAHGTTKKVKVRLEFKKDITALPTVEDPLALSFTLNYVQK